MSDRWEELQKTDEEIERLRAVLKAGDAGGWRLLGGERETLKRLIAAEEQVARLSALPPWHDLDELRQRLRDMARGSDGGLADL